MRIGTARIGAALAFLVSATVGCESPESDVAAGAEAQALLPIGSVVVRPKLKVVLRSRAVQSFNLGNSQRSTPAPAGAAIPGAEADADCESACGDDAACRLGCTAADDEGRAPAEARSQDAPDCLECGGRETGFHGGPIELFAALDHDAVVLSWTTVEEADDYVVTALRTKRVRTAGEESFEWVETGTSLRVGLETGFIYLFRVVPRRGDANLDELASKPVFVEL